MYKKILLFEIPPFYIESDLDDDIIKNKVSEFDKERSVYGFKKLNHTAKRRLRRQFCEKYGFKFAYDSIISFEAHKQGRTKDWLHRCLIGKGFNISYISLCQKINGYSTMPPDLKKEIYKLLLIC